MVDGQHRFRNATTAEGDHRRAARLSLDRRNAEIFFAREEQSPTAAQVSADDRVGLPAEERDRGASQSTQPSGILAGADDEQGLAQTVAGLNRQVEPLV